MRSRIPLSTQRGSLLLEAFIAILLFSIGMLGLAGVQAAALKNAADARYRAEASYLANQIISEMWADNPANLASYRHRATTEGTCAFSGAASTNAKVVAWLGNAGNPGTLAGTLPRAGAQIKVEPTNIITVTVCWQNTNDKAPHSVVGSAHINDV